MVFKSGFYLARLMRYIVYQGSIGKIPIQLYQNEYSISYSKLSIKKMFPHIWPNLLQGKCIIYPLKFKACVYRVRLMRYLIDQYEYSVKTSIF